MQIDFYTTIIDNYWDMGFSFNLAISLLYYYPNLKIRFFADDEKLFLKLNADKEIKNIVYYDLKEIKNLKPTKTIFNFFDRKIDFDYLHSFDYQINLINFSYFLMHNGVNSLHDTKYTSKNVWVTHFVPSLLQGTWWIIINPYLNDFKNQINKKTIIKLRKEFLPDLKEEVYSKTWVSVFCYKETFIKIKYKFKKNPDIIFFTFDNHFTWENIINMPFMEMNKYYKFGYLCDKNIVRWENSLVNSLLTWKPFLWDIYKEHNWAHKEKIQDFSTYLLSNFWQSFNEYNNIFKEFNIWNIKKWFWDFIEYKNNFEIIKESININSDLIKNINAHIHE